MKKNRRIAILALAICVIMSAWAAAFAKAESEKCAADSIPTLWDTVDGTTTVGVATAAAQTAAAGTPLLQRSDLFSERDLKQEADLADAVTFTVSDAADVVIT